MTVLDGGVTPRYTALKHGILSFDPPSSLRTTQMSNTIGYHRVWEGMSDNEYLDNKLRLINMFCSWSTHNYKATLSAAFATELHILFVSLLIHMYHPIYSINSLLISSASNFLWQKHVGNWPSKHFNILFLDTRENYVLQPSLWVQAFEFWMKYEQNQPVSLGNCQHHKMKRIWIPVPKEILWVKNKPF